MTDIEIPDAARRARDMYAQGMPTRRILAETGLSLWQFYNWLDGRASKRAQQVLPVLPRRRVVHASRISAGDRLSLVTRMMRASERQVAEIERRIGTPDDKSDKDARTLALIARTLRELTTVDAVNRDLAGPKPANGTDAHDSGKDDAIPQDVDALRRSLARKLEAIIAERGDPLPGESDAG
jgi:hypothetical protein